MTASRSKPGVKPRFNKDEMAKIAEMLDRGLSQAEIARVFGVSQSTISRVIGRLDKRQGNAEPEPGTLQHMIWRSDRSRALYNEIERAYRRGDTAECDRLWAEAARLKAAT